MVLNMVMANINGPMAPSIEVIGKKENLAVKAIMSVKMADATKEHGNRIKCME